MTAERGDPAGRAVGDEHVVDEEVLPVVVHSSPRYGRFLMIGVVIGLVVAAVLTFLSGVNDEPGGPLSTGASGVLRVFGVYAAVCVGIGLVVMGLLAILLGRRSLKHARSARAEHATTLVMDLDTPVNDDVPRWVRDDDDLS
ncbi:hypothetical protein SAMN04487846_0377 [Microbacterium sp. cf046]|uniref:hypothetical protein n=1 Tax=Microbacterium sp. cf046 TaxID=1761803 RepID=UPI0008ED9078|nr:hypothetical protein [Microbacterium sp. cf046]SFR89726.1 hypothetical protein SAMN04487846_0377 [Microbacterium sp. cf046]